jgi:hypothetical protein
MGLAGGETLNCTVTNFGFSDLILPVVSTSTDGTNFTTPTRIPDAGSLADNVVGSPQNAFDFQFVVPASVTHVRLWKYFPYTIADKDALLAGLPAVDVNGPVRFNGPVGLSTELRDIDMIELSNGMDDTGKHRVWIHAGIHCAETTSYFVVEGLVDFLLNSGSFEAQQILDNLIIDIVPMLNPDGVARGNYRASAPNPPSDPSGADMEAHYFDSGIGTSDFSECQTVIDQIKFWNGEPGSTSPTANPVEIILNLHSTHGSSWPYHFRHNPIYPPNGVISAVTALEDLWITAFRLRSPQLVNLGTNGSSSLLPRAYVEAFAHDFYSNDVLYTGPDIMAITYEGTYQGGHGTVWNDQDDYRDNGVEMALALMDYFGIVPVELSVFQTD